MTLTLYHNPVSTCSQKVRLVLAEKKLPYDSHVIVWGKNEHLTEEYLKINPNGVVPSLVHDGAPVIDSSVICEYLDEVFPGPGCVTLKKFQRLLFGCRLSINYSKSNYQKCQAKLLIIWRIDFHFENNFTKKWDKRGFPRINLRLRLNA